MILKKSIYLKDFRLSYLILILLPALPFLVNAKIQWLLHVFLIWAIILESGKVQLSKLSKWNLLLLLPVFWSFLYSLDSEYHNIIQSLFYLLTPFLMLTLGIQMGSVFKKKEKIYLYIIYHGSVGSALFLGIGLFTVGANSVGNIYVFRNMMLWGSITNVLAVILLLFHSKAGSPLAEKAGLRSILLIMNALALVLTVSRTYYLLFFVFLALILFQYQKKIFMVLLSFLVFGLISIMSIQTDNLFIYKIQNSISEISNTREFSGYDDVGAFYRAYETQQAMKTFKDGQDFELMFGHGLQKMVDLGAYVELAGTEYRFIPVLHNGYAYLLLRAGYIGLIFYFVFFLRVGFIKKTLPLHRFYYLIYLGCLLSLLISNYVINSFFSFEMLMGWVIMGIYFNHWSKSENI